MRVPLSWLREFNDCDLSPEDLADVLTKAGLEVESIDRIGAYSRDVVVAEVLEAREIEGSDLRLVTLDLGSGETRTAITGAPNVPAGASGSKVPAAKPGAILIDAKSDDFALVEVAAREMRGVRSEAVLCSERELGLSLDHEGVLLLDDDAVVGTPIEALRPPAPDAPADVVLEIAILPNYGRCLSIVGVAREVAALTRTRFRLQLSAAPVPIEPDAFPISIECPDIAPRYSGLVVDSVRLGPSPAWLQRRLVLAGSKPINNLVDVTNYVMLELGQPMHAFDLELLPAREITVRRARPGERMHTLDQTTEPTAEKPADEPRELDESIPLITSGGKPVAIAGVIGGLDSEVKDSTRSLLLESANFDFIAIRKAMTRLKVITDAGTRFSRQADPAVTVVAIRRAVKLLEDIADAKVSQPIADCYPHPAERRQIEVSVAEIARNLGLRLDAEEIVAALARLGIDAEPAEGGSVVVDVPGFRPDLEGGADIAEEVIRVLGFDRLEDKLLEEPLPTQRRNTSWEVRRKIRSSLVGCGLADTLNYSLTTPESEARLLAAQDTAAEAAPYVRIVNPASQERSALRRTVLGSLLENVARNHRVRDRIAMFEIGTVFHPERGDGKLPAEILRLGIVLSGPVAPATWREGSPRAYDFFDLRGIVTGLARQLHIDSLRWTPISDSPYHPGVAAALWVDDQPVGALGQIHPTVCAAYDLDDRVVLAAELAIDPLVAASRRDHPFRPFSRFPTIRQDLALVVDDEVPAERVMSAIREAAGELLVGIRLFDLYTGEQLGAGKKSLAFELSFCASDRSLTEDEINALRESMLGPLEESIGARIR